MLDSSIGRKIASLTQQHLFTELINDAYKPKMHKIYSLFMRGVKVDFALNIRKSPFALKRIEQEVCFAVVLVAFAGDLYLMYIAYIACGQVYHVQAMPRMTNCRYHCNSQHWPKCQHWINVLTL